MSDEVATFKVNLAGRDVEFRRAGIGQIMILQRMHSRRMKEASEEGAGDALSAMIIKTLDFIDTLIVHPEDRQFVEDEMLAGSITWQEIIRTLGGGASQEVVADDETPPAPKKIARKSPKAAAVTQKAVPRAGTKR